LGFKSVKRRKSVQKTRRLSFADDIFYKISEQLPVREGDVLRVRITEMTVDKRGIARIGLYKINIPGSKMGEEVKVRITKVYEKEAVAERLN